VSKPTTANLLRSEICCLFCEPIYQPDLYGQLQLEETIYQVSHSLRALCKLDFYFIIDIAVLNKAARDLFKARAPMLVFYTMEA
jgi:hypothetical protein